MEGDAKPNRDQLVWWVLTAVVMRVGMWVPSWVLPGVVLVNLFAS